jgi:hypothetical protein
VIAAYVAAVGCRDAAHREELIEAAVSNSFVFCSGAGESHGRDAFSAAFEAVHALLPADAVLARTTPIEEHHGRVRYGWSFQDQASGDFFDQHPFAGFLKGMDFAVLDSDGRLGSVTVFYDAGLTDTSIRL